MFTPVFKLHGTLPDFKPASDMHETPHIPLQRDHLRQSTMDSPKLCGLSNETKGCLLMGVARFFHLMPTTASVANPEFVGTFLGARQPMFRRLSLLS